MVRARDWALRRLAVMTLMASTGALAATVAVVAPGLPSPAQHALEAVQTALVARGHAVRTVSALAEAPDQPALVAGLCNSAGPAAELARLSGARVPARNESYVIWRLDLQGRQVVTACGTDARGLAYALYEIADRISGEEAGEPFAGITPSVEQPYIGERAVSIYTMHRRWFEQRLYDEAYWHRFFQMLARSRINSFVVIFGYENGGFLAPPYPYFFDVEGFPGVRLVGITAAEQQRNVQAFRRMIALAHDYGLEFTPAIWDHIYRGGVQGGGIPGAAELAGKAVPGLVTGLNAENLIPYTKAALRKFLETFPEIDGIQFRMHEESGLKPDEMPAFWHEVFVMIRQLRPGLRVDLRAKGLPDSIVADALQQGLRVRVATKYWMEQMGLPFHPTHINRQNQHDRRHGYADLLRYPQTYRMHWRLWNGGTTRLLLWASPEYVSRFARSARLYDSDSFEVNEMLATWMLAEPHDRQPYSPIQSRYRFFQYDFERYWHFYQVWGRAGYNPETPAQTWEREFRRRFGAAGPHLMRGLHRASWILPWIVASAYRYALFPTTRGWAEMSRMEDLPRYARDEEPSDTEQFLNVREAAELILKLEDSPRRGPDEISAWLARTAEEVLRHVRAAQAHATAAADPEFLVTVADLRILAHLAEYHSHRLRAGLFYNLYERTGDLFCLDQAIQQESEAVAAWRRIVEAAGDVYVPELAFGVHDKGFPRHWKEELARLEEGLEKLRTQRQQAQPPGSSSGLRIAHVPLSRALPGETLRIRATVGPADQVGSVLVLAARDGQPWSAFPARQVDSGMYEALVPAPVSTCILRYRIEVTSQAGSKFSYPAPGEQAAVAVRVSADRTPPSVILERVQRARPGEPVRVTAAVHDPSGVRWVRLRYRHLTQFEDYHTLDMKPDPKTGLYAATIPAEFVVPEWNLMYYVEVMDEQGNGRLYPDLEREMPYVIVHLDRTTGRGSAPAP